MNNVMWHEPCLSTGEPTAGKDTGASIMKMKKIAIAMGVATLIAGSAAQAEFSANVAITSDYMFRGVSQNDNDMALSLIHI